MSQVLIAILHGSPLLEIYRFFGTRKPDSRFQIHVRCGREMITSYIFPSNEPAGGSVSRPCQTDEKGDIHVRRESEGTTQECPRVRDHAVSAG